MRVAGMPGLEAPADAAPRPPSKATYLTREPIQPEAWKI